MYNVFEFILSPHSPPFTWTQESVVHKVQGHLKESCSQFPRLSYLSDKEVLRVMSHNGDPMAIMPLITRVFPSIKSLQCTEIISNQSSVSFRKLKSDIEEGANAYTRSCILLMYMGYVN